MFAARQLEPALAVNECDVERPFDGMQFATEADFIDVVHGGIKHVAVRTKAVTGRHFQVIVVRPHEDRALDVLLIHRRGDEPLQDAANAANFLGSFMCDMRSGQAVHEGSVSASSASAGLDNTAALRLGTLYTSFLIMLGSHLSIAGGMVNALHQARKFNMDCVQVFTKNQR